MDYVPQWLKGSDVDARSIRYRGTVVAASYCPPSNLTGSGSLDALKARFTDAVTRVALAQPHLHVGIAGEDTAKPTFIRLEALDLRNHVHWKTFDDAVSREKQYLEELKLQLDSRYDNLATQPGWRVIILHDAGAESIEVLYVWNHPHHDGMGGKIFHQQLFQHLNNKENISEPLTYKLQDDPECLIVKLPESSDRLPPPPEVLTAFPMTTPFLLKKLWKEVKPYSFFPPTSVHATWAPVKLEPFTTRFQSFSIDNDTVVKVVASCRRHQTTVTGLLHALVLLSLSSGLGDMKGFAARTPYDLRHYLPSHTKEYPWLVPKETICNYVSILDHEFHPDLVAKIRADFSPDRVAAEEPLSADILHTVWSVAARVRQEIKDRLDSGIVNDMIGIMKFAGDWRPQQESEARKPRYLSWLVTNLGVLEGGLGKAENERQGDDWTIHRTQLFLSTEVPSAAISVAASTIKDGQMDITCSWQDCVVDPDLGANLMRNLNRWLTEIGSSA
ncbi:unnamed protein product [Clonostachys solani]|uniref:Alcohol acetyltransferase FCK4 n=1 Tax=Clonostachys solani TaxID=160281 RepID=A0A9N9Z9S7_9HYPO|nr:unnamed protein product [Clonostachys solani]